MAKQLEARLFKKHSSGMIKAIRYPVEIATRLHDNDIIDKSTLNRVQKSDDGANELITAVAAVISSQRPVLGKRSGMSNKFKEILEIFKDEEFSPLDYIVKSLEDEYHNILEQEIDSKEDSDGNAIETIPLKKYKADSIHSDEERQVIIDSSKEDSDIETIPLKKYKANPSDEEPHDNSNLEPLKFPVPPSVKKEDYPLIQRLRTTPPILYSEAGELVKDVDVILVTATDAEFRAVMGQAKPVGTENAEYHTIKLEDHTTFYLATYGKNKVAIINTDQGARETRRVLDKVQKTLQAQNVIAVGICYGLKDRKIKLGDVIVSRSIVDISDKRAQDGGVVFRQSENKAGTLYDLFRMKAGFELKCKRTENFVIESEDFIDGSEDLVEIKPGVIVSESTLVADQKYKDQILEQIPHALGGEMEGAGIMELAGVNDFQWIVIKAVADWGDGNKEICRKWQPFASVAAASYVHFHLERNELRDPTKQSRGQQSMPHQSSYGENPHLRPLADTLIVYSKGLSISGVQTDVVFPLIKAHIEAHIGNKLKENLSKESVKQHLDGLIMNALIPSDITDWCYETLEKIYADVDSSVSNGGGEDQIEDDSSSCQLPPLFSKDTVYHASLCSLAVNHQPSPSSLSPLSEYGHSFDNISSSIMDSKIVIAQQGDIFYISFADSDDIIETINEKIPMRYFCELLYQYKRLIFTGFSMGGILAQMALEYLWKLPLFSQDVLLQNTACIMFGYRFAANYSTTDNVNSSSYLFLIEDDLEISGVQIADAINHLTPKELNILLIKVQDGSDTFVKFESKGLKLLLQYKLIHHRQPMKDYHLKVLRGYLDKAPDPYHIPPRQDPSSIKGVESLIPSISNVELHQHKHPSGYELAVVINGDNLWFCHKFQVKNLKLEFDITPKCVTQKQISYNFSRKRRIAFQEVNVEVEVFSTFRNLPSKEYPIIYKVPDPISFRQSQLAKQTPSQIIELSFLSALLEQSPSVQAGRPTKRFSSITKFLQEAASLVPMESITFAIASCDNQITAYKCAQAFLSAACSSPIPVSKLMADGCESARKALVLKRLIRAKSFTKMKSLNSFTGKNRLTKMKRLIGMSSLRSLIEEDNELTTRYRSHSSTSDHFREPPSKRDEEFPPSAVVLDLSEDDRRLLFNDEFDKNIIQYHFKIFSDQLISSVSSLRNPDLICGRNIGEIYPISESKASNSLSALTPLPLVLTKARHDLSNFSKSFVDTSTSIGSEPNSGMLDIVNNIVTNDLQPCVKMLGGFMELQIRVPLVNNPLDTAKAITTSEKSGAVGVWALFAMSKDDIENILQSRKDQALVIQITEFIEGMFSKDMKHEDDQNTKSYNAKLQFLLQGLSSDSKSTVTCSNQYISYSLERELVGICKKRKISTTTRINTIISGWDSKFKSTALALVPFQYRPLLARWLIWALNIHQLRESLAKYTTVGVIGLVNSGKSTLVNKIFKIETVQGNTQAARTTVPLIYNMDNEIEGLSVIDFPGVDDKDESIGGLAKLLVGLAQIVIFVCEYKRFHTKSAEEWMEIFHKDFDTCPILVCLTNSDRLYEDQCDDDMIPTCPEGKVSSLKMHFEKELKNTVGSTKIAPNCEVKFCSLTQSRHSPLNNEQGRESMRKIGIFTPQDIGHWIKHALEVNIQQKELANKFDRFFTK